MRKRLRLVLIVTMFTALFFGFLHLFVPDHTLYNFERLHIFLFNLVSGGTILLHFTEGRPGLTRRGKVFFSLSIAYALLAFWKLYLPAIMVSFILAAIVESVRIKKFSLFPTNFFDPRERISRKFHQAALLCLSSGLVISGLVILNNEYLNLVTMRKLQLDTFFLGFSFPLSLISFAIMFSFMKGDFSRVILGLKNICFWNVNLGVIIFFVFILFELFIPQVVVTTILFLSIILIYYLFRKLGRRLQQKSFLTSGMFFLWYTAVTGIAYIILAALPGYDHADLKYLLRMHSYASLYGWNLSGLAVICRRDDFPIRLHSKTIISVHWITAIVLAPLGTYYQPFAVAALVSY
ncbi:MAG: hypothetical protein GY697_16215, partial [Desulfobacterales bacterium]|nr:hypothetical protein [Desulfobacterales bacterium]